MNPLPILSLLTFLGVASRPLAAAESPILGTIRIEESWMRVNAMDWSVGSERKMPAQGTKVDLVGNYNPRAYRFQNGDFWKDSALKPTACRTD